MSYMFANFRVNAYDALCIRCPSMYFYVNWSMIEVFLIVFMKIYVPNNGLCHFFSIITCNPLNMEMLIYHNSYIGFYDFE